jgi:molybdenum cofactor cytidylyltransferase
MRFRPTIVVPAAGRGSRFGAAGASGGSGASASAEHKLVQALGGGTVLAATLRNAIESQLPVVVVTTAALAPLVGQHVATRDIVVLSAGEAARGMGYSIAAGVAERSGAPGWLVLPADMPLVRPGTLLAVASALEHHAVAYAQHKGRRGHPVGFAAELFSELILLDGDDGARRVLARYPAHAEEVADAGVLLDVDTPADLEAVRTAAARAAGATPGLGGAPGS